MQRNSVVFQQPAKALEHDIYDIHDIHDIHDPYGPYGLYDIRGPYGIHGFTASPIPLAKKQ